MSDTTFDYIVIGAGTAGCLMANRLSADKQCRVLLIEAGRKDDYHWIHIPVGYLYCIGNPRTDWLYNTEPDAGLNGRTLRYPRGKTLGGSSSINGMIYMRGQSRDYDQWAALTGDDNWRWDKVPARTSRSTRTTTWAPTTLHGAGGEWRVEKQRLRWDILDAFAAGRGCRPACRTAPTSTAAATRASATSRSTRRTAGAGTPPRPSCARPATAAPTSSCGPAPRCRGS